MCTMCTVVCTLKNNGTHPQAFNINAFRAVCTMCTIHAHTRTREISKATTYNFLSIILNIHLSKKHSHVREYYLNGTHGTHLSESFIYKGFPVFTFFKNLTHMINMVHIDNKNG